ncbi:MAG: Lrp/AsnC family transcriptional regulator [Parvularculaceae bacterium]|nr:MAG: Lrp/AsnC family transcriptional regulator [Parvularculaceae bacterium]
MGQFDQIDINIIRALQADAGQSVAAIGEAVGLSQNACWRRIKRLEEDGILTNRVAIFDAERLGYSLVVFAIIRLQEHRQSSTNAFARAVAAIPEVVEFYRMSGDIDYIAKILARDIQDYDRLYKKIITLAPVQDVSSSFSMENIKYSTAVPVG